ncbi:MAG: sialidase family protein [Candidatus Brocadiia bacterium]|jgi:hypothetical protein|nr:sialidase family protein [Candidatus Brocadiia bacterium]
MLSTQDMGAVKVTEDQLREMQVGDYILHARGGKLEKVAVEKTRLPVDPEGHVQCQSLAQAPNGTICAAQRTIISQSTDGGRTWQHAHHKDPGRFSCWRIRFDAESTVLNCCHLAGEDLPAVLASGDGGETWEQIGRIDLPIKGTSMLSFGVIRLRDGALVAPVKDRAAEVAERYEALISGTESIYFCRSSDGGRTWPEHHYMCDWSAETGLAELSSGRLVAVMRYQRPRLPEDTPELLERTGAAAMGCKFPYKHVFLTDSDDGGRTWTEPRQLTTVFGQCRGTGVGLSGERLVVAHDHRYPRAMASARAMVSLDGGRTWEDEVYYLSHGMAAGYNETIRMDGDEMLTLTGSCYGDVEKSQAVMGRSEFAIIRWKLVR